jgi:hypothetical protein
MRFEATHAVGLFYTIFGAEKMKRSTPVDSVLYKINYFITLDDADISTCL